MVNLERDLYNLRNELAKLTGVDIEQKTASSTAVLTTSLCDGGGGGEDADALRAKIARKEKDLFAERRSVFRGWLKNVFLGQAVLSTALSYVMATHPEYLFGNFDWYNDASNNMDTSISVLGFWWWWLFIVPSLRSRRPTGWEKEALDVAFLGTPLVMGQTNLLAPQAYLRITQVGLEDPLGYVISVILIGFSIAAMALSARALKGRDFASVVKGGTALQQRALSPWGAFAAWAWIVVVLLVTLSPHLGVLLLSFAQIWSFSPLPDAYTLQHYATVFGDSSGMIRNTLVYCGLAAALDVVIGVTVAYLMLRTTLPARQWLDWVATASLAVPGIVLAIGYLRLFKGVTVPGTDVLLTSTWVLIMIAYAVRRLPYALRSCVAALQQLHVSLEEAAESLGADKARTIRRVVVPLMTGGILAGFVTSFITAAVELSATLLLVSADSQAPISYGIYLYMQSVAGRGPGAALGVLAIAVVALGTWWSHHIVARADGRLAMAKEQTP